MRIESSRTNVAGTLIARSADTAWASVPPSLQETQMYRWSAATYCGDGASTQWTDPSSHQNDAASVKDALSTSTCTPVGFGATRARNCFWKDAVSVVAAAPRNS